MNLLTDQIMDTVVNPRPRQSHKGYYGRILIIGGTERYGGAVIMNTLAAVNSGAGLVSVATNPSNFTAIHCHTPEAMVVDYHSDLTTLIQASNVILIGSGLGDELTILQNTLASIQPQQTLIVDGSALTLLADHPQPLPQCQLIITPHQMEWQRLSDVQIDEQDDQDANWEALINFQPEPILVLKSDHTQIYLENEVYQLTVGGPYQATGGMGDTLAGMIAGFTAQFKPIGQAVLAATYAHSAIAQELSANHYVTLPTLISQAISPYMQRYNQQ